jgi:hypothetical protein
MGNLILVCCKSKNKLQIENLQNKLNQQDIKAEQYKSDINKYRVKATKLYKYESTFQDSETLATHILSTDLKCLWMDDAKEKEYLISVFNYITVAMNNKKFHLITDDPKK